MLKQISERVWQFYYHNFGSNCYLLRLKDIAVMIDTSSMSNRKRIVHDLKELNLVPDDIHSVLLTHLHWDHIGNLPLFKKAKIYVSREEFEDFKKNPADCIAGKWIREAGTLVKSLKKTGFNLLDRLAIKDIKVIRIPGHTRGSVAFYMPEERILFSGDTLFEYGIGRTDLPTSNEREMYKSLEKLKKLDYRILCAGH